MVKNATRDPKSNLFLTEEQRKQKLDKLRELRAQAKELAKYSGKKNKAKFREIIKNIVWTRYQLHLGLGQWTWVGQLERMRAKGLEGTPLFKEKQERLRKKQLNFEKWFAEEQAKRAAKQKQWRGR